MPESIGGREQREIPVRRLVAGAFLTSFILPLLFAMVAPIFLLSVFVSDPSEVLIFVLIVGLQVFGHMFVATLAPTVALGLPLYVYYRRKSWYRVGHYLIGGAIVGLVYVFGLAMLSAEWRLFALVFMPAMILGAIAALIFWLVVVRRSPRVMPVEEVSRIFT